MIVRDKHILFIYLYDAF